MRRTPLFLPLLLSPFLALVLPLAAADWTIETIAGTGKQGFSGDGGPAIAAEIDNPFGVGRGPDGALYYCEYTGQRIRRIGKDGIITTIAGTGQEGFTGDGGSALEATFNKPHEIRFDAAGDLYIVDMVNHAVRKIDMKTGILTTLAGTGQPGYSGDGGPADKAEFGTVIQIALDPAAKHLYVADIDNMRIRRIALATGIVETVAGNGKAGKPDDGADAKSAPLSDPRAVVAAADGSFYILERGGNALRFVDAAGKIKTVAGNGKPGLSGDDGPALEATMSGPKHLCLDRDGSVIIADTETNTVRRYDPKTGKITRIAGTGKNGAAGVGGDPLACELARPHGVTVAPDGKLIITDSYNNRVLRIVP
jgi:DNA-binding beta-propeller fold protein YncE